MEELLFNIPSCHFLHQFFLASWVFGSVSRRENSPEVPVFQANKEGVTSGSVFQRILVGDMHHHARMQQANLQLKQTVQSNSVKNTLSAQMAHKLTEDAEITE